MKTTAKLRELLKRDEILVAPGAHSALAAKVIEKTGFDAVYITGFGREANILASPDIGAMTLTEVVAHARNVVNAVSIPVICDMEGGFGNAISVTRAVKELENAGVAAVHLEDQISPVRCPWIPWGRGLVPTEEMAGKIKAALDARVDPDFVIIARTDSDQISLEEMIERMNRYREAGADILMPIVCQLTLECSPAEHREVHERLVSSIRGPLLLTGLNPGLPTVKDAQEVGYKVVIFPLAGFGPALKAMMEFMEELKRTGTDQEYNRRHGLFTIDEIFNLLGLPKIREAEEKYIPKK